MSSGWRKLERLDAIYYKHASGGTKDERLTLRMLNIERKKLEKQLVPNLIARLVRELMAPFKINAATKQESLHRTSAEQNLRGTISKAGFEKINWQQVETKMQQGESSFKINHSQQINADKRMEYDLSFSKDQHGRYKLDQYQAALKSDAHPEQNKKQTFVVDAGHNTTASQAFNYWKAVR